MIEIFEGRIGGGKTYSAVERIANVVAVGEVVCTNIRLKFDALREMVAKRAGVMIEQDQVIVLDNERISEFHKFVPWGDLRGSGKTRVLVVVDEAHLFFNARDWSKANRELLAFLTQSDKVSVDVIFISQSALNIDKQFMRLVLFIWRFRDLRKWSIPGLGVRYPFDQILACQYDYDGITLLNRWFRNKNKTVFGCYETAALLTDFPTLEGIKTKRELKKVERKSMAKLFIIGALILGIIGAFVLKSKFQHMGEMPGGIKPSSSSSGLPLGPGSKPQDKGKTLFDLYDEHFRGWMQNGNEHTLETDGGWYELGEMSNKGLVVAVSDRRAKIIEPDGRTGFVMATQYQPPLAPPPSPSPSPVPVASGIPKTSGTDAPTPAPGDFGQPRDMTFINGVDAQIQRELNTHYVGGKAVEGGYGQ